MSAKEAPEEAVEGAVEEAPEEAVEEVVGETAGVVKEAVVEVKDKVATLTNNSFKTRGNAETRRCDRNSSRFEDVLYTTCMRTLLPSDKTVRDIPLCQQSLKKVTRDDVLEFSETVPSTFSQLENRLASAMTHLHNNDTYRVVGLYVALLNQNIDLLDYSKGPLAQGTSGEACQRLAAVVKQSINARDEKRSATPRWVVATILTLSVCLVVSLVIVTILFICRQQ